MRNEGDVQIRAAASPYPVSYRSIVPKEEECANLLVPVCLSASHIAYGSIRMEPVFMILGQSAGTAAALAIDGKTSVQKVDYAKLQRDACWPTSSSSSGTRPTDDKHGSDRTAAGRRRGGRHQGGGDRRLEAEQRRSRPFVGDGYLHDGNAGQGQEERQVHAGPAGGRRCTTST